MALTTTVGGTTGGPAAAGVYTAIEDGVFQARMQLPLQRRGIGGAGQGQFEGGLRRVHGRHGKSWHHTIYRIWHL